MSGSGRKKGVRKDGFRRFKALGALEGGPRTAEDLADEWDMLPNSAYKVLERLRKYANIRRRGSGHSAEYEITERGLEKLKRFREVAE